MSENLSFVITGAGSYLGRALAEFLSTDESTSLVLTSHHQCDFKYLGQTERILHCPNIDLTEEQDVAELCRRVNSFFKNRFHVINCAGYFPGYKRLSTLSLAEARRVYEGNVLTLYSVAKELLPLMKARGGGHFMAFSSHTVYQSYPLMAAFTSAKAAVESLIQCIAYEYSKDHIIANTLALATLATEVEKSLKPYGDHANWLQPLQVCQLIRELVEAPFSIMNGNTIHVFNHSESYFHQSYYDRIHSENDDER